MADDNNNEKQDKQPENDTSTSYINQLRSNDTVEDALTAHIRLWEEAKFKRANQQPERSRDPLENITQQQPSEKQPSEKQPNEEQSGDEDSPRSKK